MDGQFRQSLARNVQKRGADSPLAEVQAKRFECLRERVSHAARGTCHQERNRFFQLFRPLGRVHDRRQNRGFTWVHVLEKSIILRSIVLEKSSNSMSW